MIYNNLVKQDNGKYTLSFTDLFKGATTIVDSNKWGDLLRFHNSTQQKIKSIAALIDDMNNAYREYKLNQPHKEAQSVYGHLTTKEKEVFLNKFSSLMNECHSAFENIAQELNILYSLGFAELHNYKISQSGVSFNGVKQELLSKRYTDKNILIRNILREIDKSDWFKLLNETRKKLHHSELFSSLTECRDFNRMLNTTPHIKNKEDWIIHIAREVIWEREKDIGYPIDRMGQTIAYNTIDSILEIQKTIKKESAFLNKIIK